MEEYLLITVRERNISVEVCASLKAAQGLLLEKAKKEYLDGGNSEEDWDAFKGRLAEKGICYEEDFAMNNISGWSNLNSSENVDWSIFVLPDNRMSGAISYCL